MRGGRLAHTLALAAALLATGSAHAATPAPYGTHDAGGFRNVLPPGQGTVATLTDIAANLTTGETPSHWLDQQPLYEGLVTAAPNLDRAAIDRLFKDATFGVPDGQAEDVVLRPRAGVTIIRDRAYGVPHVYGSTRGDVMFGAGYAGAADRLFMMDVLRHTGRAQLSSFAGGSRGNREMDRTQWEIAPYTEADLQRQVDQADDQYGAAGLQVVRDVTEYVAGINAYIADARGGAARMPGEYAALGRSGPEPWKITDVLATASLIGGIFGKGGGDEVRNALVLRAFEKRFGRRGGRRLWQEFRMRDDPEAPVTVKGRFPYRTASPFARRGLALPDPGSVSYVPVGPSLSGGAATSAGTGALGDIGAELLQAARAPAHASNWLVVSGRESASGRPIGVLGPQVGYYAPQILMELDLHGPGIDARGAAFPGVNLYIQLGHGRDYAWSATTATSDNVDTFAEVLCEDDFHYRYKGRCVAMEKLDRTNAWQPTAGDSTPAGSETLTAYRTVHGIVYARGTVRGQKVAFARARSTYFHEADSAIGFIRWNDAAATRDAASFQRAAEEINFAFNWAYIDGERIAYYQSGWYPRRARGTSPEFPILGTGEYDWVGFDPSTYTSRRLSFAEHPRAIDPPYAISWNNKQAPRWTSADDQYSYGPVQRQQLLEKPVRAATAGARKITLERLVQVMAEGATRDLRAAEVMPLLSRAIGVPADPAVRGGLDTLKAWAARGGHRRDLDGDDRYDDDDAVALMDAWWPRLVTEIFKPGLGEETFAALRARIPLGDAVEGARPNAPAFFDGWWNYVNKDLRRLFARRRAARPPGWSRSWCGGGSRARCRRVLQDTLMDAQRVSREKLYGRGDCAEDPDAECFDRNRSIAAGAIGVDPAPFQNRPTFQQVVEVPRRLPR